MSLAASNRKLLIKLLLGAVAMFAFAIFVLPPIYDAILRNHRTRWQNKRRIYGGRCKGRYIARGDG